MDIILTSSPEAAQVAVQEIKAIDADTRLRRWLAPGVGWVELEISWADLVRGLGEQPPIFIRHLSPAQITLPLERSPADLDELEAASLRFLSQLDPARTFSVQTRLLGKEWPYAPYDVNTRLSEVFVNQGMRLDVRQPEQVLSVVLAPTEGFLGLSSAQDNLSDWAGGARRFRREEGQISRAEFKLLEAMELFQLQLPDSGLALDLGAAPGGWTRVLRQHNMQVVAVDPGELDERIATDPAVRHLRQMAQGYLRATGPQFDVILNDMRIDARDSAQIMGMAADRLKPGGWGLIILKLPRQEMDKVTAQALDVLGKRYRVVGARQLFHNRSEITVALRPWVGIGSAQ